jgi:mono/diheme cytochrome c family protein
MRGLILGVLLTLIALVVGGWWCLNKGYISFAADQEPSSLEQKIAMSAVDTWADHGAGDQKNPSPVTDDSLTAGAQIYMDHCAGCHGLPSKPTSQFAASFYPPVPEFFSEAPDMSDAENFFIIQHGIRWTGMPAWNKTLSDSQIWQVVGFLGNLQKLPPSAQKILGPESASPSMPMPMPMK